jgi:hypothetical protein
MRPALCFAAAILFPGLALCQKPEVMDAVGFLTKDVPELELTRLTFAQAVERVRNAVSTDTLHAPEVKVVRYESPQNSDDFPFREDGDFLITSSLSDVTVHETLELLCFAAGFALDLKYGDIRCFQVPHEVTALQRVRLAGGSSMHRDAFMPLEALALSTETFHSSTMSRMRSSFAGPSVQ